MIRFERVTFTYPDAAAPTLAGIDLVVPEGELCLVVGATGTGKSTLLRAVNGLVPRFTGGRLEGRVIVASLDTSEHPPRDLAGLVGLVGQDPTAGFVTDVVEDELAFTMETLGIAPEVMRRRVEEALDLVGLATLRRRALATLSGGERQRVAIAAALTAHPRVLVLDEPTSALDPPAAEEVVAVLQRLVHDLGTTVLVAEHRLERVVQVADRVLHLPGDGSVHAGAPAEVMAVSSVAPPVVELGRLAGWDPLPLSVRDARRHAEALRDLLAERAHPVRILATAGDPVTAVVGLTVAFPPTIALRDVTLSIAAGEVVALMGRNGAGKTTLLRTLAGVERPGLGAVTISGRSPAELAPRVAVRLVGLVPQDPADLLYADTVAAECAAADHDAGAAPGTCRALLARLVPDVEPDIDPRDLSEGQRLGLVLAIVMTASPPLLLLDEPTRGLDYAAKARLVTMLRTLAAEGRAILLATHDVELAAAVSTRTVLLAEGEVVVDGPTSEVVVTSPAFAPQVAKVVAPLPWLTVAEVAASLADDGLER
jgi:energy-coupling factor transporter ATP-binding protein EcfA2